jgi:RNA polymerase sigma-70 factor (ECF subfamily)
MSQQRNRSVEDERALPAATVPLARIPVVATDAEILAALAERRAVGCAALYDRYRQLVRRILVRLLGVHEEVHDLVQDAFLSAIRTIDRVRTPEALRSWMTSVAVFTARQELRRRRRKRFLLFLPSQDLPEIEAPQLPSDIRDAVLVTHRILSTLPADLQIAFVLRFVDGMALTEVAEACRVSLATIKRRLGSAKNRFEKQAQREPALARWLERW